ncbi:hypothetical protein FGO68_gene14444 [Halteria grandinella]|uniref:Uncharacterized protein n=1 Tax=Halteria grandinella TaxID=5974 RepID=A0A8J8NTG0_HALGN|nr:hypothetical protein FGO68_gene14444 [Halteria grandinella]
MLLLIFPSPLVAASILVYPLPFSMENIMIILSLITNSSFPLLTPLPMQLICLTESAFFRQASPRSTLLLKFNSFPRIPPTMPLFLLAD